jgi:hypothetical protein
MSDEWLTSGDHKNIKIIKLTEEDKPATEEELKEVQEALTLQSKSKGE